jgi:hypothetical protein
MEQLEKENTILRRKVEMYMRNWFSESDRATRKDRENHELKIRLEICQKDLNNLKKFVKRRRSAK